MIGTTARGAHDITSRLTDCTDGGDTDLTMGNCCGEIYDRQANCTLDRHTGDTTRMGSCPPDNVDGTVLPAAHYQGFVRNFLYDTTPLLRRPTPKIISPPTWFSLTFILQQTTRRRSLTLALTCCRKRERR